MDPTPAAEAPTGTLSGRNSGSGGSGDLGDLGLRSRAGNLANLTDADRQALAELLDTPIRLNVREFLALNLDHTIGRAVAVGPLADGDADRRADAYSHVYTQTTPNGVIYTATISDPNPDVDSIALADAIFAALAKASRLPAHPDVSQGAVDAD